MERKPIEREESFFTGGLMEVIIQQTIMCSIVVLAGFYIGKFIVISDSILPSHTLGQTMAFLILGWTSLFHIFVVRSRISVFKRTLKDNPQLPISTGIMFLMLAGMALLPPLAGDLRGANFFGLVQMDLYHWLICIGISLVPIIVAEYGKFWDNYKYHEAERLRVKQQKID